ncbi:tRNA (5-methylaminomethyl-2-thiouridine)(34)-methyltransferase MnmD [Shewanella gelidii]|uniref:MnmC-like methyltransferase domain-containing protein n=1 Tax=Shewanella gelidii TaxID=1642821 RepID=A0A917N9Q8_9GAMM|nr:tRNA (5-methylaminomethyl-2-thiouridine)(34)-methyltransferase MnmD [Shewanella gelidii]MCL1097674.1 tRNA (5-methylaminomethyl-2-thiouridine)(34)-methyltransferase MnmD [Shewanella gelidii]GGI79661.1 hypothetical protein GCM10009332_16330 [Shewanella gelidii]
MDEIQLQLTADGSHTLMNTRLDESYHAHNGALSEAMHVYVEAGFDAVAKLLCHPVRDDGEYRSDCLSIELGRPINILEFGFGSGLNAILTLERAVETKRAVRYIGLEAQPLPQKITSQLNYQQFLDPEIEGLLAKLHSSPWEHWTQITPRFDVLKIASRLEDVVVSSNANYGQFSTKEMPIDSIDLIYFDAFAPNRQPEVWSVANYQKCFDLLRAGGLLVTYCANGQFKRDLKTIGYQVEVYPGALGRREMTRAWKPS